MAGKPLHELRKAAEQARVKTVSAEKVEVAETPVEKPAKEAEEARGLNDILSSAKMRAARGVIYFPLSGTAFRKALFDPIIPGVYHTP